MMTKEEARTELRSRCKPGTTIYAILRHVSRSGMQRRISFYTIRKGEMVNLDWLISKALDMRLHSDQGIVVNGGGMDMGFHIVGNLSYALHGYNKPRKRKGKEYKPGYTLLHRWL